MSCVLYIVCALHGGLDPCSRISLLPCLCCGFLLQKATLRIESKSRGSRVLPIRDFFLGYRTTALQPDEVLVHMGAYRFLWCPSLADLRFFSSGPRTEAFPATGVACLCVCMFV